ncbi:neuraminidase-like domain-containing protein [uncultured Psychrobacter sp.]|uniref:neuraminidase-like domain-containing protein n=1 Tax=uncultured Psychrobacter sp. TaxID=259303 RepID=UPI00345A411A
MNAISFPLQPQMSGQPTFDLQSVLQVLLERGRLLANDPTNAVDLATEFKAEQAQQFYGGITAKLVAIFQQENALTPSGTVDESTAKALNTILKQLGLLDAPQGDKGLLVRGTIVHADGHAAADLPVQVYDCDMRSEELLGATRTDAKGSYKIRYTATQFRRAEKDAADLLVKVVDDNGTVIATSDTVFNAAPEQIIDITLQPNQDHGPSEYERYLSEMKPLVGPVEHAALTDEDLEFLTGETGIPLEHLSQLRLDAQWQKLYDVEAAAFYGLLRKGLPTDLRQLLATKSARWRTALKQAIADHIVPSSLGSQLDDIVQRLSELALENAFKQEEGDAVAPLGLVVATAAGVTRPQQEQFVRLTLGYEPKPSTDFWQRVQSELNDEKAVRAIQRSLQASVLTFHHLPLLTQVQQETQGDSVKAVAGWSETEWLSVIDRAKAHGMQVPKAFINAEDYANAIIKKVDAYLPSDRLVARATRTAEDLDLATDSPLLKLYAHLGLDNILAMPGLNASQQNEAVQEKLGLFDSLFKENPALDLRHADLIRGRIVLQGKDTELEWGGISEADRPRILKQARAFQRVMPLSNNTETRIKLLSAGFDSSSKVLGTSVERLAIQAQLPVAEAAQVRRAASDRATKFEVARYGLFELLYGPAMQVDNLERTIPATFREMDNIEKLFGAQNFCDCEHCSSILSQSAYFVDLMAFVDKHISQAPEAFGEEDDPRRNSALYLRKRRPDLWSLELSCKNIHNQVPYLEVVNHTFEQFLIGHIEEVSNRNDLYQELSDGAKYSSFKQPFLPAPQELDLYLSHFSLKRADVFAVLDRLVAEQRLAYLNVSQSELAIIVEPNRNNAHMRRLFHAEGSGRDPVRIPVPQFMRATGLSREEVTQLRDTTTLYPFTFTIERTPVDESLGQLFEEEVLIATNALSAINKLDTIHRWIRLWRKTDWDLIDFDFVLSSLNSAGLAFGITDATVYRVADLKLLQDRLHLNVEELVSLFHQIPSPFERPSGDDRPNPRAAFLTAHGVLLHRLFGEQSWTDTVNFSSFDTDSPTVTFANDEGAGSSDVYRILAGLSLNESELVALLIDLRQELEISGSGAERTMKITVANLSVLYRHVLLARKLKCSIAELFPLIRLVFGAEQTAVRSLEEMLQLSTQLPEINVLPFSLAEMRWLVLDEGRDAVGMKATEAQLTQLRDNLPEMDSAALHSTLGDIYGWKTEVSAEERDEGVLSQVEVLLALAGVTLTSLQVAVADGEPEGALHGQISQLEKWYLLQLNLELTVAHERFIADNAMLFGSTEVFELSLIRRLAIYRTFATGEAEELALAHASMRMFGAERSESVAQLLKADATLVASLLQPDVLELASNAMEALAQLQSAVALCQTIGVNGDALAKMTASAYAYLQIGRDAMLGALLAKYPDEAQRNKLLEPYTESMLELRRDGLVDYLLSPAYSDPVPADRANSPVMVFHDPVDLYRFFLMDAQMDGCARTSWVLAGISSLQLYVQRCLMNLEQSGEGDEHAIQVPPSVIPPHEWAWRKNYRVWEANRRIFLYPENYIYPDLRDDKTPYFEEAVDELQQQEISQDSAESAYKNYFDKFLKVANMNYAGATFRDQPYGGPLYLFAHTHEDPPEYHYRTLTPTTGDKNSDVWSHWHRVDLPINVETVSPILYQGKLHVFWVNIKTRMVNEMVGGNSKLVAYKHTIDLNYSHQNAKGTWEPQTKVRLRDAYEPVVKYDKGSAGTPVYHSPESTYDSYFRGSETEIREFATEEHTLMGYKWDRVYPILANDKLLFRYSGTVDVTGQRVPDSFRNRVSELDKKVWQDPQPIERDRWKHVVYLFDDTALAEGKDIDGFSDIGLLRQELSSTPYRVRVINGGGHPTYIASLGTDSYLLRGRRDRKIRARPLGSTIVQPLGAVLHEDGLDTLLSVETQTRFKETRNPWLLRSDIVSLDPEDAEAKHIDFKGPCGNYYRELYFHLPFQIAFNLNADQKFAEAQRWFHYIFDPTAADSDLDDLDEQPGDRNWRYSPFRGQKLPNLQAMLTDEGAIAQYRNDPFNPWAIARLRPGALQKAVVMKYIDNLLDWGDYLFTQDSYESINEATLLYVTALDILGDRPVQMGACSVPESTTFADVAEDIKGESEFVVLENYIASSRPDISGLLTADRFQQDGTFSVVPTRTQERLRGLSRGNVMSEIPELELSYLTSQPVFEPETPEDETLDAGTSSSGAVSARGARVVGAFLADMSKVRTVFCVPVNEHLLGYWDRVEDRLFKIRNCMNIRGMRRALALYAPRIDPMLLVRAKAAGLSLEDVLQSEYYGQPPIYRFVVLIEKARSLAATVQGFGGGLLSALEKKDVEELTLMRARHEQNIISLTRQVKENQIAEAQRQRMSLEESQTNIGNRLEHYTNLVEDGLSK